MNFREFWIFAIFYPKPNLSLQIFVKSEISEKIILNVQSYTVNLQIRQGVVEQFHKFIKFRIACVNFREFEILLQMVVSMQSPTVKLQNRQGMVGRLYISIKFQIVSVNFRDF
jgi:hypothetical protein